MMSANFCRSAMRLCTYLTGSLRISSSLTMARPCASRCDFSSSRMQSSGRSCRGAAATPEDEEEYKDEDDEEDEEDEEEEDEDEDDEEEEPAPEPAR